MCGPKYCPDVWCFLHCGLQRQASAVKSKESLSRHISSKTGRIVTVRTNGNNIKGGKSHNARLAQNSGVKRSHAHGIYAAQEWSKRALLDQQISSFICWERGSNRSNDSSEPILG